MIPPQNVAELATVGRSEAEVTSVARPAAPARARLAGQTELVQAKAAQFVVAVA